jgi:hypothetical protein
MLKSKTTALFASPWAKQREVHGYHEEGPLVRSLRVHVIAAIGDRVRLSDPELAAVARAPAAVEIRFI